MVKNYNFDPDIYEALKKVFKDYKPKGQIAENEDWYLTRPKHHWDMNYHLIHKYKYIEHLIDIDDIDDDDYQVLKDFNDVDHIINTYVWRSLYEL